MAEYKGSSWGGAIGRTYLTDWEQPDKLVVKTSVSLPDLERNNWRLAEEVNRRAANRYVARVPMTVWEQSIHEKWGDDDWKRYLNSAEAAPFRVWKGRV